MWEACDSEALFLELQDILLFYRLCIASSWKNMMTYSAHKFLQK